MDEGTARRDTLTIADEAARIGARVTVSAGAEQSTVALNALTPTLDQGLDLFADVALHPAFKPADIERVRAQQIQSLRASRLAPASIAPRVLQRLVFGPDHPFGRLSTEESLAAITREEIVGFHARWFAPQNATVTVVGDTTLAEIMPKLEKALGSWRVANPASRIQVAAPAAQTRPVIYLVDRPGSPQSYIVGGLPMAARNPANDSEYELTAFNTGFGGNFTSRINMNLREEKGWSYGVSSAIVTGRGPRMFRITAQVQTDKTRESIVELQKELTDVLSTRPLTAAEVATSQNNIIMGLSSRWQGSAAVSSALQEITTYGLPDTYYQTYPDKVRAMTPAQALAAGRSMVPNQNFIWVVVGDRAKIEAGLRQLGPEVRIVDADGNPAG
jgi:predicted Zn-dependent peptidase